MNKLEDTKFDTCEYSEYFGDYSLRICNHPNSGRKCNPNCSECTIHQNRSTKMSEIKIAQVIKGGIYQHYKGTYIEVLDVGKHTETNEDMIIYHHVNFNPPNINHDDLEDKTIWIRPARIFFEYVLRTTTTRSWSVPRFKLMWNPNKD